MISCLCHPTIDCVGEICSCKHAKILPPVALNATMEANRLLVGWNVTQTLMKSDTGRIKLEGIRIR